MAKSNWRRNERRAEMDDELGLLAAKTGVSAPNSDQGRICSFLRGLEDITNAECVLGRKKIWMCWPSKPATHGRHPKFLLLSPASRACLEDAMHLSASAGPSVQQSQEPFLSRLQPTGDAAQIGLYHGRCLLPPCPSQARNDMTMVFEAAQHIRHRPDRSSDLRRLSQGCSHPADPCGAHRNRRRNLIIYWWAALTLAAIVTTCKRSPGVLLTARLIRKGTRRQHHLREKRGF
jgi:hypothetical protein